MAYRGAGGRWSDGQGGPPIDTTSATAIIGRRTAELEEYAAEADAYVVRLRDDLDRAAEEARESREKLEYWRAVLAVTEEVDRRLAAGEKVRLDERTRE